MSNKLSDARDDIQGQLDQLKSAVDNLLGNDFRTQHASGKFGQGYDELTTGLKSAVDGIGEMGEALRGMMQAIQDLDQQLAGGSSPATHDGGGRASCSSPSVRVGPASRAVGGGLPARRTLG